MSFEFSDKTEKMNNFNIPSHYYYEPSHEQYFQEEESYLPIGYHANHFGVLNQFNHSHYPHNIHLSHHSLLSFPLHRSSQPHYQQQQQSSKQEDTFHNNQQDSYCSSSVFTAPVNSTHNYYQIFQASQQQQVQPQSNSVLLPSHQYQNLQQTNQYNQDWSVFENFQGAQDADAVSQSTQESPYFNCSYSSQLPSMVSPLQGENISQDSQSRGSVELKNEDLTETFGSGLKSCDSTPLVLAKNESIKSSSADFSLNSSQISLSQKQQSQLKNANKFCMVSLLNFLTDVLPNSNEVKHLIKYIIRVKGSGKMRQKVDIFTLAHFRVLFLTLNDWNITHLTDQDIKIHRFIFSEFSRGNSSWTKEDLDGINQVKQQLLSLSLQFFEDSSNIKQKIQSKAWQNETTGKHYIDWVGRIAKGIKKMSSGVYIHRF